MADPSGLPGGLAPFLRAGQITGSEEGVQLHLPPGPGLDRLRDPNVRRTLERRLGELVGHSLHVEVTSLEEPQGMEGPQRIDEAKVREDRLREFVEREPALGPAVESLDLEILD